MKSKTSFGISFGHWFQNWFRIFVSLCLIWLFGYQKMALLVLKTKIYKNGRNLNPKPVSKSVLVTDSKNDFRFYFFLTRSIILGTQKCQKTLFLVLRKCHFSWKKFKFETVFGISDQNWFQNCLWIWILAIFKDFGRFWSFLVYIGYLL